MERSRTPAHSDGATSARDVERGERLGERVRGTTSPREHRHEPTGGTASRRERQKDEFGGFSWLSTLAGWLSAAGLTAILAGILSGAGAALALNQVGDKVSGSEAETIGLAGGVALLIVLAVGYFFGGYVAGRMARFDGKRQGLGVWLWGIIIALAVAALAAIGGSKFNVLDALNLPRLPVDSGKLTTGGLVALLISLAVTLGAAMLGGKTGERFHHKVDRV